MGRGRCKLSCCCSFSFVGFIGCWRQNLFSRNFVCAAVYFITIGTIKQLYFQICKLYSYLLQ